MSFILKNGGTQVAISGGWNPSLFGNLTGTSFPAQVDNTYTWSVGELTLAWEDDPAPPPPTFEQVKQSFIGAVQEHLDNEAQALGYDNIVSACSYAGANNPFQAEGQSFVAWRGEVWAYCHGVIAEVVASTRPIPTVAELIAELPSRV
jgi:hypothetical protein